MPDTDTDENESGDVEVLSMTALPGAGPSAGMCVAEPMYIPPYIPRKKTPAQSTKEWRQALACAISFEEKVDLFRVVHVLARSGNMQAIAFLVQYGMGKPGIGAAGKLMDDVVADDIEERMFKALSHQEQLEYIALQEKMQKAVSSPSVTETMTVESESVHGGPDGQSQEDHGPAGAAPVP